MIRNPWNLFSAFALFYGATGRMAHLPCPGWIAAFGIAAGLSAGIFYFLNPTWTQIQSFKNFLRRRKNDLENYSKLQRETYEELHFWQYLVLQGFQRSCGKKVADEISKYFLEQEDLSFKYSDNKTEAIKNIIQSRIRYLNGWISSTPPIDPHFKSEDLRDLERTIRPGTVEKMIFPLRKKVVQSLRKVFAS